MAKGVEWWGFANGGRSAREIEEREEEEEVLRKEGRIGERGERMKIGKRAKEP